MRPTLSDHGREHPGLRRHPARHSWPVGIIYVSYDQPQPFAPARRRLLHTLASHAAVAIANAQRLEGINRAAITDALTESPNHHHLMDRLDEEIGRARRSGHPLVVMMLDVDDFKTVNDAYGHTMGDAILRQLARTLRETLRSTDTVGRYGGDEFLILRPETDQSGAAVVADGRCTSSRRCSKWCATTTSATTAPATRAACRAAVFLSSPV